MFINRLPNGGARLVIDYGPHPGEYDYKDEAAAAADFNQYVQSYGIPNRAKMGADPTAPSGIPEEPSPLARYQRGARDLGQGIKQSALMLSDQGAALDYTKEVSPEFYDYQRRVDETFGGTDIARMGGQFAPTAPLSFGKVTGLGSAALAGARGGAATGAMTFTPEPPDASVSDLYIDKGMQIAGTGALGATAGAGIYGAAKGAGAIANWTKNAGRAAYNWLRSFKAMTPQAQRATTQGVSKVLSEFGIDFTALDDDVRSALMSEATDQVRQNGVVDPAALARKVRLAPYSPTTGQVTQNDLQLGIEQNAARQPGSEVGQQMNARLRGQREMLSERGNELLSRAGGETEPYVTGRRMSDVLQGANKNARAQIGQLYDEARTLYGDDVLVPGDQLQRVLGEWDVSDDAAPILNTIRRTLAKQGVTGDGPISLTLKQHDEVLKSLSKVDANSATKRKVAAEVREALYDDLNGAISAFGDPGTEGAGAFNAARGAARERFQAVKPAKYTKALERVLGGEVAPENIYRDIVKSGTVDDVKSVVKFVEQYGQGTEAADLRMVAKAQALSDALKAAQGSSGFEGLFSGSRFKKALFGDPTMMRKLQILFEDDPGLLTEIRRFAQDATDLTKPSSATNWSNSANTLISILRKVNPRIASLVTTDMTTEMATQGLTGAAVAPRPPAVVPQMINSSAGALSRNLARPATIAGQQALNPLFDRVRGQR